MVEAARTAAVAFISCQLRFAALRSAGHSTVQVAVCANATARLITGTRSSDYISPVLRELHWLPIQDRVKFELVSGMPSS